METEVPLSEYPELWIDLGVRTPDCLTYHTLQPLPPRCMLVGKG